MDKTKIQEAKGGLPLASYMIKKTNLLWSAVIILVFVMGMWRGYILHQEQMFQGMVRVAEGFEGTIFNVEIDLNETLIVEAALGYFNESGFFEEDLNDGK